ncbi:MAG: tRNA pseudouridine(55) synthase TruB [Nitrospirae bacterium]|nr:tRNA pseudouridine(55) synthase TruB [Nitrospirota bacterium]
MDIVINLNKPKGITSQDAVTAVKKILNVKKAGHAGTLDPSATGILLVCVDKATKLASYFSSLDKEYIAVMKLGEATDTQDSCGHIVERADKVDVQEDEIENALKSFAGRILQKPPMFSALKHKGQPLYKFARKGVDISRELREVHIRRIELLKTYLPFVSFRVLCSKGTYVRTLCDDIGRKLGTFAHLSELERSAIGPFGIEEALNLDEIPNPPSPPFGKGGQGGFESHFQSRGIYSMDAALSWMPEIKVKEPVIKNVRNGNPIRMNDCLEIPVNLNAGDSVKIKSPQSEFLAIGSLIENYKKTFRMDIVFA